MSPTFSATGPRPVSSNFILSAISILNAVTRRWDWFFYPSESSGQAEMRLELPGGLKDEDLLRAMRTAIEAALEGMSQARQIAA